MRKIILLILLLSYFKVNSATTNTNTLIALSPYSLDTNEFDVTKLPLRLTNLISKPIISGTNTNYVVYTVYTLIATNLIANNLLGTNIYFLYLYTTNNVSSNTFTVNLQFLEETGSNSVLVGSLTIGSNTVAAWPTAPFYRGDSRIVNSNGYLYVITSLPTGTLAWSKTNLLSSP